ncbi:type II toxin-antitoxin system ParD family antitoxin [Methylobacterium sp. R2-1]|uniref:type II toxin-antitoxin system ParD family antitoxin n=1 Tax=Methylobacterium sp. R2-1 TaxID=2587064 RepID=UPI0017EA898A|nr:type II toxin-antitoxin system ParD family antitoxin [Methylobacterium sp. R2-1]MBB2965218.1 antitoxin ParD1/3/4 [Methylobacterium sp. R2-1]
MAKPSKSLNVSLTPELSEFIAVRVASGRYQSASEVVRAGLWLLERDEADWLDRDATSPKRDSAPAVGASHG